MRVSFIEPFAGISSGFRRIPCTESRFGSVAVHKVFVTKALLSVVQGIHHLSCKKSWSSRKGAALRPSGHASALAAELRLHKKSPHISVQGRKSLKQPQKAQEGEKCLSSSKKSKGAIHHDGGKVSEAAHIGWPFRLCRWYYFSTFQNDPTMNRHCTFSNFQLLDSSLSEKVDSSRRDIHIMGYLFPRLAVQKVFS